MLGRERARTEEVKVMGMLPACQEQGACDGWASSRAQYTSQLGRREPDLFSTNHSPYTTWVTRPGLYREPRQCTVDSAAETRRRGLYPASDASKNVVSSPARSSPWAGRVVRMAERRRSGGREVQTRVAGWCHLRVRQAGGGEAAAGRGVVVVPCMSALGGRGGSEGTRHVGQGGGRVGCPRVRVG